MTGIPVFPPRKDVDLAAWTANFASRIQTDFALFGLTSAQADAYRPLSSAYVSAHQMVINPNTNSKQAVIAKNQAKFNLLRSPGGAWDLVDIVQAFPGTTDAMRGELGLRIKDLEPTPVPAPPNAPMLTIVATLNRTVKMTVRDIIDQNRRAKPEGVDGATILYHVGATAPQDASQWTFAMNTSKTAVDVLLPAGVPANSVVWFTAMWFNQRKQTSPPATVQSVVIGGGYAAKAA